jgi:hypothetical protein
MKSRIAFVTTTMVISFLAIAAHAHRVGLSRGQYVVGPREVTATLTFASGELAGMQDAVVAKALVFMGGAPCRGQLVSTAPVAPDGVAMSLRYDCAQSGDVAFRYDFVDALEPGHRHIVEITGDDRTTTFVAHHGDSAFDLQHASGGDDRSLFEFFRLGVEHVLTGWDHLAFLLGVALAAWSARAATGGALATSPKDDRRRLQSLAWAVTAFTVAHSVTLAATALGWIVANAAWVEPLIALSIAWVGLQILSGMASAPARTTLAFGLVHGMGFAGALRAIAIPHPRLPAALALFNGGVEVGQLLALVPAVVVLTWLARRPALLPRAVRATSAALALGGVVLCVSRGLDSARAARAASVEKAARTVAVAGEQPTRAVTNLRQPTRTAGAAQAASLNASDDVDRFCRAIHELPRVRRAECEHSKPGIILTASCTAKLAPAVASGAVAMSPGDVTACVAEMSRRYDTCDFVGEHAPPHARACERVLHGTRAAGETCRSWLECRRGLFCDGAGPLDGGVCHPPRANGEACGLSIDPLAAYVSTATVEEHPECDGRCVSYRCRPTEVASGRF